MSVAPGSSIGSFRVLYIALIYMSLEINLAYTLPRHPPPTPPPLRPPLPSPSGLGLHLSFPLAPRRMPAVGAPHGSSRSCRGAGEPARQARAGLCHLARPRQQAGREGTGANSCQDGGDTAGGALSGHRVPAQGSPRRAAQGASTARAGLGRARAWRGTYVISMDWFSRSGREGAGVRPVPPASPPALRAQTPQDGGPQGKGLLRSMSL